jgi:hypothetical protein
MILILLVGTSQQPMYSYYIIINTYFSAAIGKLVDLFVPGNTKWPEAEWSESFAQCRQHPRNKFLIVRLRGRKESTVEMWWGTATFFIPKI